MPWPSSTLPTRTSTTRRRPTVSHVAEQRVPSRRVGGDVRPAGRSRGRLPARRATASTIRRWAPQRHRLRSSASATRSASASGSSSSSAAARTTIPEMQKPHCAACRSRIACCTGCGRAVGGQPLDGGDRLALRLPHRGLAGRHHGAVERDEAGAAQALAAAEAGADQAELVAQHGQQRGVRVAADLDARAVDHRGRSSSKTSGWWRELDPGAADVAAEEALGVVGVAAGDGVEEQPVLGVDHPHAGSRPASCTNVRR